jgi:microcystin degradation protein MlrC
MAKNATALIAVRTYPHIDYYERASQGFQRFQFVECAHSDRYFSTGAELLQRTLTGQIYPKTVIGAKRPQLRGLDGGRTQTGPMRELIDRSAEIEKTFAESGILVISVCAGFTAADIYDIGPSVTVTYDVSKEGALDRANRVAEEFASYIWQTKEYSSVSHLSISEAISIARSTEQQFPRGPPVILAEVTDNPGSGHYGDAVNLLRAMIGSDEEPGLQNAAIYAVCDPEAVQQGMSIGVGNSGMITLGGKVDSLVGGPPLTVFGTVLSVTDGTSSPHGPMAAHVAPGGPCIRFRVKGVEVMVISRNGQALDVAQLEALGCDFKIMTTVCLKSNHHFRASFEPLSRAVYTVDGGGLGQSILQGGRYVNVRRPIWPLDSVSLEN